MTFISVRGWFLENVTAHEAFMKNKRLLLVDDHADSLTVLTVMLGERYLVSSCSSAAEALANLKSFKPDLLIRYRNEASGRVPMFESHQKHARLLSDSRHSADGSRVGRRQTNVSLSRFSDSYHETDFG